MATERYRMRFDFQLNINKEDEYALAEQITMLKQQGLYSKTVRDGIRLISDLRDGKLDVLFDLFPWVRAEFLEYMASVQPQKSDTEIHIKEQLARIEELLANTETTVPEANKQSGVGGPKAMKVPPVGKPIFDLDDIELDIKKAKANGNSAQNFLDAAFGLIQ